jgi:hypothetical protein
VAPSGEIRGRHCEYTYSSLKGICWTNVCTQFDFNVPIDFDFLIGTLVSAGEFNSDGNFEFLNVGCRRLNLPSRDNYLNVHLLYVIENSICLFLFYIRRR